ncbi:tRNA (N6-threonylcarbamoyladenosine(37)-N6)-methyltransferase TrmO [Desulfomicrobium escambiense]|uniref:tRNA (N6-threonylcarbamoyladenosine(37)-N6)-methyltransferase TrmO n=1 Tax=Desulfomicrobium escambiense TaxID=29503 RepID=UPI00040FBA19|nr:tRNA (N6-threonylcarbamoyladenosine(37)-N6)-methyltransferase TrmO [Desulfomicrobium escambiense]
MNPSIVGIVHSHLRTREECPKHGDTALLPVWIEIMPEFEPAATDLQIGDAVVVLTWMHQGDRSVLRCHPRGNRDLPMRGIFSTRSPDRPTPIGLHNVRITGREGLRMQVHPLEVIDGTPVIDIKPDNSAAPGREEFPSLVNPDTGRAIIEAGRDGWLRGLFAGFNGNISVRQGSRVVITATGSAKGHLSPRDLAVVDLESGDALSSAQASSELSVHLEIYRNQPAAQAIVHTHPPKLIALSLRGKGSLLQLPLYEGQVFATKLTRIPSEIPGTPELGESAGQAARYFQAVFMDDHGLVCWGGSMTQALGLSEELESLAAIALAR